LISLKALKSENYLIACETPPPDRYRAALGVMMNSPVAKRSAVIKRSIVIDGHKTSVSLENEFWDGLHEIAARDHATLSTLIGRIDRDRTSCNLSSAIRVFVFSHLRVRKAGQDQAAHAREQAPGLGR
jgi:predicted DNA-binding ribbon-helix-helix protein